MANKFLAVLAQFGIIDTNTVQSMQQALAMTGSADAARQYAEARLQEAYSQGLLAQSERLFKFLAQNQTPSSAQWDAFWAQENTALWASVKPAVTETARQSAIMASVSLGDSWRTVNEKVVEWTNTYYNSDTEFGSIPNLNRTARQEVATAFNAWQRGELAHNLGLPSLALELQPTFGEKRAKVIAITETTRIYSESTRQAALENEFVVYIRWMTGADERVCFPAGTMVRTNYGDVPIQSIVVGDSVLTRHGYRRVIATSRKLHTGSMTTVATSLGEVTATSDHPFWTLEQGWLNCGDLDVCHTLETFGNKPVEIIGVVNFDIANSANYPSVRLNELGLSFVSFGVSVPVDTVNLKGNAHGWNQEVNGVSAHFGFLDIFYPHSVKRFSDSFLYHVFAIERTIASKAAKLTGRFRLNSHLLSTIPTIFYNRWAAAFLGAESRYPSGFATDESFSAFFADKFLSSVAAFPTANSVSVGNGRANGKLFPANRADFRYHNRGVGDIVASTATEVSLLMQLGTSQWRVALDAISRFSGSMGIIAGLRTISLGLAVGVKQLSALWARQFNLHALPSISIDGLHPMTELYHTLSEDGICVYDIQVEDVPEFYANGILVHNCPICAPLHGRIIGKKENGFVHPAGLYTGFPPAHVNCRCRTQSETLLTAKIPLQDSFNPNLPKVGAPTPKTPKATPAPVAPLPPKPETISGFFHDRMNTRNPVVRKTVEKAEARIYNKPVEHAELVNAAGKTTFKRVGEKESVSFADGELLLFRDKVLTHNHPVGTDEFFGKDLYLGDGFSRADLKLAQSANVAEIRAVTPTNVHILRRTGLSWPEEDITAVWDRASSYVTTRDNEAIRAGNLTYEDATAFHYREVMELTARKLNLEYTVVDHDYNR